MPSQAYIDRRSLYVPGFNADDIGIYSCIAFNSEGISYGYPYEWYFTPPGQFVDKILCVELLFTFVTCTLFI